MTLPVLEAKPKKPDRSQKYYIFTSSQLTVTPFIVSQHETSVSLDVVKYCDIVSDSVFFFFFQLPGNNFP